MTRVAMTDAEKQNWFKSQIELASKVRSIESEEQLVHLVRDLRKSFKSLFDRDVAGSFIRRLMSDLGLHREHGAGVQLKRDWMFAQLDENQALRDSKTQMRKVLHNHFGEVILNIVFDELWQEYHSQDDHPEPSKNVDIHGQGNLFS
mgnify:CR=1 FL=1|tara:strand:- start:703 stop:1143 length:441 start_codon:yes stop_codon:yes gene_type:complete